MYERAIKISEKTSYTGAGVAVCADLANAAAPAAQQVAAQGYTLTETLGIIGAAVAVLGFVFGQFWAWRKHQREAAEHRARMRRLQDSTKGHL